MIRVNVRISTPFGETICWDARSARETENHVTVILRDGRHQRFKGQILKMWNASKAPFF